MLDSLSSCCAPGQIRRRFDSRRLLAGLTLGLAISLHPALSRAAPEEDSWARTVSQAANSVVSLQLSQLRNFDDSEQGGSTATGFVVDAERGIILTNRHVVGSGPIRISATFQNQERVDAVPLYRDPVHDFGFIRYDPQDLQYSQPQSLSLRPDKVSTGMNIRVIGSDGGEQLSILPGTIARLDREVPTYGRYGYNDFNTFYLQAASGTSGGSSGSPVIDFDGDVVALNAAANTRTASSFFLPLPRILHALQKLQADEDIDRGGFQTLFNHQPFRDLRRLGLDEQTEATVRASHYATTGMITVGQVIPGGVADGLLEPGDILVSIADELMSDYVSLEAMLDASIGQTLPVELIRQGAAMRIDIQVADLNALAPDSFLELGDSILQNMSIQHARAMNRKQEGVVIMQPGYVFAAANVPQSALIIEVEGMPIRHIDDFIAALEASADKARKRMRYIVPGREFNTNLTQFDLDGRWFGNRSCTRVDDARFWNCDKITLPETRSDFAESLVNVPRYDDALLDKVAPAMVLVDFAIPYASDNVYARHYKGVGIVIDKVEGLVAVDRNTVPVGLGEVDLTFFGSLEVPGKVVFLHPRQNVALLQYDASLLSGADFEALQLSDAQTALPAELTMVGYRADGTFRRHEVDDLSHLTIGFGAPGLPRFQQAAMDVYGVPNVPPSLGGPLVDEKGDVHAVYMSFAYEEERKIRQREWAMPSAVILEAMRMYRSSEPYHSLDVSLSYKPLALARQYGLPDDWLLRFNRLPAEKRRVLHIEQVVPGTDAEQKLASGDVILAIDQELVSDLLSAEMLSQQEELVLTVLRSSTVVDVTLQPSKLDALGTQRIVSWAGATFEDPFSDIAFQKAVDFPGVYIADTEDGSPALWDGLYRNRFVVAIDGEPVEDLDDLLALVSQRQQDQVTRLTVISMSGRKQIVTVQPEYNFWPTFEVRRLSEGWKRIDYTH